ncbi:hypothetical protein [Paractinoplanes atraurantiacus]|uniref:Lipoprotein n=1 Tax=Paractinoplanes atraurantiacus TaxID=1036182 RepID=A0A285GPZ2_9ACTN|nr:hypothetical protein [Actinoplanes atraurantiacus]SNY25632.1 hypothetical protein SAMN05421748_102378 [Actinoplanes atraurantiacus]
MFRRETATWRAGRALSVAVAATVTAGCTAPGAVREGDPVAGPEWNTSLRYGPGSAGDARPASLSAVTVQEHPLFDRLLFSYGGSRPGYRVSYRGADGRTLTVTLKDIHGDAGDGARAQLPAIREVRSADAADGVIRTSVTVAEAGLPFRVGLDVGSFYVDVAHPGAATS